MNKCREEFEKAFPVPAHWIEFNEKLNKYHCPHCADYGASMYQAKWEAWQEQQKRIDDKSFVILELIEIKDMQLKELQAQLFKIGEQQKRIDELEQIIKLRDQQLTEESGISTKYVSKFDELHAKMGSVKQLIEEYRDPPTEDKTFRHALSIVADELEQALKGGEFLKPR